MSPVYTVRRKSGNRQKIRVDQSSSWTMIGTPAMKKSILFFLLILSVACNSGQPNRKGDQLKPEIDMRSYQLGIIAAFSEVVGAGVKKLALSSPMDPSEMAELVEEAKSIATDYNVQIYLEEDFLVTDLFPESITRGKHVLLIYREPIKADYMAIKAHKNALIQQGVYDGEARLDIARKMGRLLSYTEEHIEQLLQ